MLVAWGVDLENLCQVKDLMATVVQVEASLRRATGLNLHQSFALCCLAQGSLSPGELADQLRIHGASLSRVLKALQTKGLITRELRTDDGRLKVLDLTPEGRDLAGRLQVCEGQLFPLPVVPRPFPQKPQSV